MPALSSKFQVPSSKCGALLAALILTACGGPAPGGPGGPPGPAVEAFVRKHSQCPTVWHSLPAWSPGPTGSGARIYYDHDDGQGIAIHSMNIAGGDDRLVVSWASGARPSPDGRWLLYLRVYSNGRSGPPQYGLLELATGQQRTLGDLGGYPAWSPDGKWIAYIETAGGPVRKLDAATGQSVTLSDLAASGDVDGHAIWSPDPGGPASPGSGSRIAFASMHDGLNAVYVVPSGGGTATPLAAGSPAACATPGPFNGDVPTAWSPRGDQILTVRTCGQKSWLRMVNLAGGEIGAWENIDANVFEDWSKDGEQVLFTLYGSSAIPSIGAAGYDRSNSRLLGWGWTPRWSPDGRWIVYTALDANNKAEINLMHGDGTGQVQLTTNPGAGGICLH